MARNVLSTMLKKLFKSTVLGEMFGKNEFVQFIGKILNLSKFFGHIFSRSCSNHHSLVDSDLNNADESVQLQEECKKIYITGLITMWAFIFL